MNDIKDKKDKIEDINEIENISNDSVEKGTSTDKVENETVVLEEEVSELDKVLVELSDVKDKYLRTIAEFDNYKKRTLKEKTELILNGGEKAVTSILPIIDDMERAIENWEKLPDIASVEEGWELIYKKFISVLSALGVKKIETDGQDFNVDYHEAVAMLPSEDDKKGKVIDCVQIGYTLNDKVIRHAKVAVGQ